jgi:uncharacterized protein YndB with AHSA1/START domain
MAATTAHSTVGKTKDVGYEIGVRRTFEVSVDHAWAVITSPKGLAAWLGTGAPTLDKGVEYQTRDGAHGKVTVFKPGSHLRMSWQPGDWPRASTIQVRVLPSGSKATISFHQEHLPGPQERIEMRERWEKAITALGKLL